MWKRASSAVHRRCGAKANIRCRRSSALSSIKPVNCFTMFPAWKYVRSQRVLFLLIRFSNKFKVGLKNICYMWTPNDINPKHDATVRIGEGWYTPAAAFTWFFQFLSQVQNRFNEGLTIVTCVERNSIEVWCFLSWDTQKILFQT